MMKKSNIEQMLKRSLPKDSEDWLIACLDPFHDYQYEVHGLPDERIAPSVVQIKNAVYTLTAPASAGGGNWDASILYSGFNTLADQPDLNGGMVPVSGSSIHNFNSSGLSVGTKFGSVCLWAGAAGSTMPTGSKNTGDTVWSLNGITSGDRCRVIGVAVEVHNTTAEIYKQGSLTVAMLPDTSCDASTVSYFDSATSSRTICQADRGPVQASTLNPLLTVPGSCTWPAADGVYFVPRMAVVPRDTITYAITPPFASNQGGVSRIPVLYGTDGGVATPEPVGMHTDGSSHQALFRPYGPSGFTPIQVWMSGLSNQTTLTITLRSIVEYFPSLQSTLLPLSAPSPAYDPKVFALYAAIAAQAPYAVPVEQNAAGDYFRKILKVVGSGLQLISPVFGPYGALTAAIGVAAEKGADLIPKKEAGPKTAQTGKLPRGRLSPRR